MKGDRDKRKEAEALEKEKEAAVRRDQWLKELEAREEEDRAARESVVKLMERRRKRQEDVDRRAKEGDENKKP